MSTNPHKAQASGAAQRQSDNATSIGGAMSFIEFAMAYNLIVTDDSPSIRFRWCRCTFDTGDAMSGGYWFNGRSGYIAWREGDAGERLCVVEFETCLDGGASLWDSLLPLA